MDLRKASAILDWKPPRDIHGVQWLPGFANFYSRFIMGFSKQVALITAILKKGVAPSRHQRPGLPLRDLN